VLISQINIEFVSWYVRIFFSLTESQKIRFISEEEENERATDPLSSIYKVLHHRKSQTRAFDRSIIHPVPQKEIWFSIHEEETTTFSPVRLSRGGEERIHRSLFAAPFSTKDMYQPLDQYSSLKEILFEFRALKLCPWLVSGTTECFFLLLTSKCLIICPSQQTPPVVEIKKASLIPITNSLSVEMGRRIKMFGSGAGFDGSLKHFDSLFEGRFRCM
jgi:hypothetical protein